MGDTVSTIATRTCNAGAAVLYATASCSMALAGATLMSGKALGGLVMFNAATKIAACVGGVVGTGTASIVAGSVLLGVGSIAFLGTGYVIYRLCSSEADSKCAA